MQITVNKHAPDSEAVQVATITNKALATNVATLTTVAAHGLVVGDRVVVDCDDAVFDGAYAVASTPSGTTFTYALTHANVTSAAATGTVSRVPTYTTLNIGVGRNGRKVLLQNNGPGVLTIDSAAPASGDLTDTGLTLAVDATLLLEFDGTLYASSDADDTDLRYLIGA